MYLDIGGGGDEAGQYKNIQIINTNLTSACLNIFNTSSSENLEEEEGRR